MEIKGFITNMGKYAEGEIVGKWITFPIEEEELKKVLKEIEIGGRYEEYFFTDYENNIFDFSESTSVARINETVNRYKDLCIDHDEEIVNAMCNYYWNDLDYVEYKIDNIYVYNNVDDMEEVAEQFVEETCLLENIPSEIAQYFDYEKYGRHMEFNGDWIWFGENKQNVIYVNKR